MHRHYFSLTLWMIRGALNDLHFKGLHEFPHGSMELFTLVMLYYFRRPMFTVDRIQVVGYFTATFPFQWLKPTYLLKKSCTFRMYLCGFAIPYFPFIHIHKIKRMSGLYFFGLDWLQDGLVQKSGLKVLVMFGCI